MAQKRYVNPLSRREVLKFGAYTTVGGVLTPGISRAQAILTDTKGITARDIQLNVRGRPLPPPPPPPPPPRSGPPPEPAPPAGAVPFPPPTAPPPERLGRAPTPAAPPGAGAAWAAGVPPT